MSQAEQEPQGTKVVYVSLVRDFLDYYLCVPIGKGQLLEDEIQLRLYLNRNYRRWWCSLYDEEGFKTMINEPWCVKYQSITIAELDQMIIDKNLTEETRKYNDQYNGSLEKEEQWRKDKKTVGDIYKPIADKIKTGNHRDAKAAIFGKIYGRGGSPAEIAARFEDLPVLNMEGTASMMPLAEAEQRDAESALPSESGSLTFYDLRINENQRKLMSLALAQLRASWTFNKTIPEEQLEMVQTLDDIFTIERELLLPNKGEPANRNILNDLTA